MTNYERLQTMSVEEIADILVSGDSCPPGFCPPHLQCWKCWVDWLESECDT